MQVVAAPGGYFDEVLRTAKPRPSGVEPRRERLAVLEALAGCSERELEMVERLVAEVTVAAGTTMLRQGWPGCHALIVATGEALVVRNGEPVARVGRGRWLGERALLTGGVHDGTVLAATPMRVFVADPRQFATLTTLAGVARNLQA